ncbi:MAG: hypothetical protein AVDCRST_MAG27-3962 [uncultured Craurococcus sp.]|uniref:Transmembrane protein (PGPGW) n=1 Tax=uncultured Craurococcus sp. TaxID=1135998 RepID=A0A6J4JJW5_9PROT|nr:MAG: hypothetical protein AVDCRST_MAG27-3962 [uncultured Craurococcus sp.]
MSSWARKFIGFSLLALGVLGLVLPILQGVLFLALGLFVLRDQYPWARRWMGKLEDRFPRLMVRVETMEARLIGWSRRQGEKVRRLLS